MISPAHIRGVDLLGDYGKHLKALSPEDKQMRFGYPASDANIDNLILSIVYHHDLHRLWTYHSTSSGEIHGWGHMCKEDQGTWELAVSVDSDYQGRGVGGALIRDMIWWAQGERISTVYMHCVEDNRRIQHLAKKYGLITRERGGGERTAALDVPAPTVMDVGFHKLREQAAILQELADTRQKLVDLWAS